MGNVRYDFQEPPANSGDLRLIYCALSRYDGSWHSIVHSHAHAELFYCVRGKGVLEMAGEHIALSSGSFLLINPLVEHTERSDAGGMLEYIVIGVGGVRFYGTDGTQPRYCLLDERASSRELLPYFQDMISEVSRKREDYMTICMRILDVIFAKASRQAQVERCDTTITPGACECAEAKRLMDERFQEHITLDWLAERTHISKYYLTRAFHRHYGIAPMHYLCERRLREARHLLESTDHTLSDICTLTGFSSQSYFSQAFKREAGISPTSYRQRGRRG